MVLTPSVVGVGVSRATGAEPRGRVLVVDDEALVRRACERLISHAGFEVHLASSLATAEEVLRAHRGELDLVLTDLRLGEESGMDVLAAARALAPQAVVVVMTAAGTIPIAVDAMRAGAYDFLVKPFAPVETLVRAVERALERKRLLERNQFLESRLEQSERFQGIVGDSAPIRRLLSLVDAVAPSDSTVLVLGESGTGKELVARAIHERSQRVGKPFVAINCGAIGEAILESELFGHVRGAFTGAMSSRRGLIEEASGGTLFLDEVGEMPLPLQVRFLRVLEEREVRPVGSNETRKVDVRVVAATNRDLAIATRTGAFREDLFYRLNVVSVEAPALRERQTDIPLLVHHFARLFAERHRKPVRQVDEDAMRALVAHAWPGNVRELRNAIERSVILARNETISADVLPPDLARPAPGDGALRRPYALPFADAVEAFERSYIESALRQAKGNIAEAARTAGLDRSNFRRLLKRHGIEVSAFGVVP